MAAYDHVIGYHFGVGPIGYVHAATNPATSGPAHEYSDENGLILTYGGFYQDIVLIENPIMHDGQLIDGDIVAITSDMNQKWSLTYEVPAVTVQFLRDAAAGVIDLHTYLAGLFSQDDEVDYAEVGSFYGYGGDDVIRGSADDVFNAFLGGNGNDKLYGNGGDDKLFGENGRDILFGGDGDDLLVGGSGVDQLYGGVGNDRYDLANGNDKVVDLGGVDTIFSNITRNLAQYPSIENLTLLQPVAANGMGNALGNRIFGTNGNNKLYGAGGDDKLIGGGGSDSLNGGLGLDRLDGGRGVDRFVFSVSVSAANRDIVTGFDRFDDTIQLENAVFRQIGAVGTLSAAAFRAGVKAADSSDRIIYDSLTGSIWYDPDGNGAAAKVLFLVVKAVTDLPAVTRFDFEVI